MHAEKDPTRPATLPLGSGLLLVLFTALISGISTFINAYAVQGASSDAFVTVRNLAVAGMLVPVALVGWRYAPAGLRLRDYVRLALIGLIGGAIPFLLFFHGLQLATAEGGATTASFLYRTLFLMATVIGVVALGERFRWRVGLAAAILLLGNLLLLSLTSPVLTDGTVYVLAATALWAVEYALSKRTLKDLPSTTVGFGRMGFGAAFLAAYLAATSQWGSVGRFSGGQWEWVGISAALLAAFVVTWYAGLRRLPLGTATSVLVLGFPVTWALGVGLAGAAVTPSQAAGVALIVAGVAAAIGLSLLRATGAFVTTRITGARPPSA